MVYSYFIMGVVYSSKDIERGHTPGASYHHEAAVAVRDGVSAIGGVVLTVVHGSIVEGRSNLRSDLDLLVTYQPQRADKEMDLLDEIKAVLEDVKADTHVQLEVNLWRADQHRDARVQHLYDRFFAHHLAAAMRSPTWAVGEPDSVIDEIVAEEITESMGRNFILNYLAHKHGGVTKAPRFYNEESEAARFALQRILELPKAFARKALQMQGHVVPNKSVDPLLTLETLGVPNEFVDLMASLVDMDADYTVKLREWSQNQVPTASLVQEYYDYLLNLYPKALKAGLLAVSGLTDFVANQ